MPFQYNMLNCNPDWKRWAKPPPIFVQDQICANLIAPRCPFMMHLASLDSYSGGVDVMCHQIENKILRQDLQ